MNKCELCKSPARVYCNSDEARLCWLCDAKVHSANFLVARHVRNLLCHSCQSPTAWSGSGDKLGRTISLCEPCVVKNCVRSEGEREISFESGTDFDSHEDEDEENVEEEIYVVPLSSFTSPSAPSVVSSSGSQDRADIDINISPKRTRECVADLNSKDDADSLSLQQMGTAEAGSCIAGEEGSCMLSLRPFKFRKLEARRRPAALQTIQHRINTRTPVSGVKEGHECVDFDLNECPFD